MLWRKMFRDMLLQKAQFLSIILMIFIGLFVYAGMSAEGEGLRQSSEDFYRETHLADALVYQQGLSSQDVDRLKKQPGIKDIERRAQMEVQIAGDKEKTLSLNAIESGRVSGTHLIIGDAYDADRTGVWLDSMFAEANDLTCNDTLIIITPVGEMHLTIRGLVMQPEYIYAIKEESQIVPDHTGYGYAFISGKKYPQITDEVYNQLLIKTNKGKEELESDIKKNLPGDNTAVLMQEDFPGQAMFSNEVEQQKAMQFIFPIAFLLIALLTMITALTRMIANQRTQIGTLKALGVASWKIHVHYLSYAVVPALVGAVAGTIAGSILLPKMMFGFQAEFYTIPKWSRYISWHIYVAVFLCVLICAVTGYMVCKKELSQSASTILRPKMPKPVKNSMALRSSGKHSFKVQWNIRDICRNKMRSLITIVGVAGCMMLILTALGLNNTIEGLLSWMYEDIYTFETKVTLKNDKEYVDTVNGAQYIQEGQVKVRIGTENEERQENLTVVEKGPFIQYMDVGRRLTKLSKDGIALTYKTATLLGVKKDDTIYWKPYGENRWRNSAVEQIIRTPLAQGLYMTKQVYEGTGYIMKPTAFLTDKSAKQMEADIYQTVQPKKQIVDDMNIMLETMDVIIKILIVAAVFLGVVVLYNLGTLSFTEKIKDLATLRVLGFKEKQLGSLLAMQNTWLTLGGILLGIPLGYLLLSYLLEFMGDTMDMVPIIHVYTYAAAAIGIFLLSTIINYLMNRKVKEIKMVSESRKTFS